MDCGATPFWVSNNTFETFLAGIMKPGTGAQEKLLVLAWKLKIVKTCLLFLSFEGETGIFTSCVDAKGLRGIIMGSYAHHCLIYVTKKYFIFDTQYFQKYFLKVLFF